MIVICTKCQAKFRVADEKIGPRGAKVRCSRCQTVFLVQHDRDLAATTWAHAAANSPLAPAPPRRAVDLEPPAAPPPPEDPFAAASARAPAGDPFGGADPYQHAEASRSTLPVTDLSDLLGPATPAAVPRPSAVPPPLPPPLPSPAARATGGAPAALEVSPASDPAPTMRAPAAFELAAPLDTPAPAGDPFAPFPPPAADLAPPEPPDLTDGGLALEDRLTPPPIKVARGGGAALGFAASPAFEAAPFDLAPDPSDPFAPAGEPYDPGAFGYAPEPGDDALALGEAPAGAGPAWTDVPSARSAPASPEAPRPSPLAPAAPVAAAPAADERTRGRRSSRLRAVAMNAVALAALLLVALAILVVWRTEGSMEAVSFRPSALVGALRRGGAAEDPFAAHEIRGGVYERQRGAPLLFVRGEIVSHAPGPVAAVKVSVEVVRAGRVIARGEALAGAVPTPEELYSAGDDAALARVAAAARARAPSRMKPGEAVPFLVAIGEAPPDLEGAAIRLDIAAAGGGRP